MIYVRTKDSFGESIWQAQILEQIGRDIYAKSFADDYRALVFKASSVKNAKGTLINLTLGTGIWNEIEEE